MQFCVKVKSKCNVVLICQVRKFIVQTGNMYTGEWLEKIVNLQAGTFHLWNILNIYPFNNCFQDID